MKPRLLTSLLVLLACTGPALAQTSDILDFVPDDALTFVLVNRIGNANEQITALAKKMNVPLPDSLLGLAKKMHGINQSLDEKGSILVVILPNLGQKTLIE